MSRKPFYLSPHKGIWYVRFVDQTTGKQLTGISTGKIDRDSALMTATRWMYEGIPQKQNSRKKKKKVSEAITVQRLISSVEEIDLTHNEAQKIITILKDRGLLEKPKKADQLDFITFLNDFYDYDTSPYVREKIAHGHSIGRTHCHDSQLRIKRYWEPIFKGKILSEITRDEVKEFSLSLTDTGLSVSTINRIMSAGKVALSWAHREGYIPVDPSEKVSTFIGKQKARGILNDEEAQQVFQQEWKDERALIGNLVAATCGLRSGEVLALKEEDIGIDRLFIRHAWSVRDGLKTPKNGEERQVPLLPAVRDKLFYLAKKNPWRDGLIFYSTIENQPMDQKFLLNGFYEALDAMGMKEERKERNIVFHSWRHRYAAKMADLVDFRSLGLATGHKTQAMLEHYADHANEAHFKKVREASELAFQEVAI